MQRLDTEEINMPIRQNLTKNHRVIPPLNLIKANIWQDNIQGDNLYRSYTQATYAIHKKVSKYSNTCIKFDNCFNWSQNSILYNAYRDRVSSISVFQGATVKLYVNPRYPDVIDI